ncbi:MULTISPECIES: hypothetical protein [unclassified Halorubrum]|uniref:hypothetical protein n=1 Tax=unclassified Halorubrum TaxID=2642239 RepID=UPI000B9851E3|nr:MULTISPECIES: hypothetical protein [unclassified Halorubrum]OYR44615.1 hypothetical protein DJ75_09000 [Halorubrum sp. Eb13]OYR45141.1 hypothetical protein DJ81_05495 [Halorubrum sp. Hd13]OYR47991.1 hypothetical protein DJ74_12280 [Halorubrum sp. Ea8]OYR54227.1 hypothetical protein DJ73_05660 [Halorubrum sp. Ea1]
MNRRGCLSGVAGCLAATLAGCTRGAPDEDGGTAGDGAETPGTGCAQDPATAGDDEERFLAANETPESPGARELLAAVEAETDGLTRFTDDDGTERVGFDEGGDVWELRYRGAPHAGEDRFRGEISALSAAFASNPPDGVSLWATSLHECTTGTWHVCAEAAAAFDRGELGREAFVDRVWDTAEIENNC